MSDSDPRKKLQELFSKISKEDQSAVESVVAELCESIQASLISEGKLPADAEKAEKPDADDADGETKAKLQRMAEQRDQFMARSHEAEQKANEALQQLEAAKAENDELKKKVTKLEPAEEEKTKLQEEFDNLEATLSTKFEENLQDEMRSRIRRIGQFIENNLKNMRDEIREGVIRDPSNVVESALYRQIANLVRTHGAEITAESAAQQPTPLQEENTALKAQNKILEAQCAKLREACKKEDCPPPAPPAPESSKEEKKESPKEEKDEEKKEVAAECTTTDPLVEKGTTQGTEPLKALKVPEEADLADGSSKKAVAAPTPAAPAALKAEATEPKKSRASELLKETLTAVDPDNKEIPAWIGESRSDRIERSNTVEPRGIPNGADDLIKEVVDKDGKVTTSAPDAKSSTQVVRGTGGATLAETRKLAGISTNG